MCSAKSTARWPELISSSKLLARGKASRAHKHFHPALAMSARGGRQPILSNAVASGNNGRGGSLGHIFWFASARGDSLPKDPGERPTKKTNRRGMPNNQLNAP